MLFFKNFSISKTKGFTIIEALVALLLLTLGIGPALYIGYNSLYIATSIQNSSIASNLAQEGVEVIRAMRDTNWFLHQPFDTGLTSCTTSCRIAWDSAAPVVNGGLVPPLKFNAATGVYNYTSGTDSIFSRQLTITEPSSVELKIVTTVTWKERLRSRSITIESHLFDWR